jgi:hypothetical protein
MDGAARSRIADGAVATTQATARLDGRATELLRGALHREQAERREQRALATPPPVARPVGETAHPSEPHAGAAAVGETAAPARKEVDSSARVERALELVERVEQFVRSGRPALALTLRGGLGGRMELERIAAGVISIRLSTTQPPKAGELDALRQALEARGLSVRSLETRSLTASGEDACSPCP